MCTLLQAVTGGAAGTAGAPWQPNAPAAAGADGGEGTGGADGTIVVVFEDEDKTHRIGFRVRPTSRMQAVLSAYCAQVSYQ
mgnify:CR=1 FL=1